MGDFLHSLNPGSSPRGLFGAISGGGKLKYSSLVPVGEASVAARPRVRLRERERTDNIGCLCTGSSAGKRDTDELTYISLAC